MMDAIDFDVVVIGGGPAGTTVGALLAERGWNVVLIEKDCFPRFHIGESLLPFNMPIFERLGVLEEIGRIGVVKNGADFQPLGTKDATTIEFADAGSLPWNFAYQVERARFDKILLDNARRSGVLVIENMIVVDCDLTGPIVLVNSVGSDGAERTFRSHFLVDASGRNTFLSRRLGLKHRIKGHNSAALFAHFESAVARDGAQLGNISIYWFEHGWFWMIPMQGGRMSVGAVCWPDYLKTRKGDKGDFFDASIALCPAVAARLANARRVTPVLGAGNYGYKSSLAFGKNFAIVGDAHTFIDPIFSTGVYFAMYGAARVTDILDVRLREGSKAARSAIRDYEREMARGLKRYSWFIYRFTTPAIQKLFQNTGDRLGIRNAVLLLLAGDAFSKNRTVWALNLFKIHFHAQSLLTWRATRQINRRRSIVARRPGTFDQRKATKIEATNFAVIIPAYQEISTIRNLVTEALEKTPNIIVIDDGSSDNTYDAVADLPIRILRHADNRGKAAALVSGFAIAMDMGVDAVLTLDGDGQHSPADISTFIECWRANPARLIIGNRQRGLSHGPRARLAANKVANFWISWACGQWLPDSQCGFRLYPRDAFEAIFLDSGPERSFVFESEFLIVAADLGFRFSSVPIEAVDTLSLRASHFRPIHDITRIVLMVAWKLIQRGMRPAKLFSALLIRSG